MSNNFSARVSSEELEVSEGEEKINFLELEEASSYLVFKEEAGVYTLRGGPIDALIAYAASTTNAGRHNCNVHNK